MRSWLAFAAVLVLVGCSHEVIQNPPKVIGERKNAGGQIIEQLVVDETIYVTTAFFTPDGGHRSGTTERHYYLEKPGAVRRNIAQLEKVPIWLDSAEPVAGTDLWITAVLERDDSGKAPMISRPKAGGGKEFIGYPDNLHILVFNADGVVSDLKDYAFWVNKKDEALRFDSDNRAIVYRSPDGFKKYDVVNNTTGRIATNPDTLTSDPLP